MVSLRFLVFLLATINFVITEPQYTSVILTESGPVQGEILTTVRQKKKYAGFRGIPFAEPPLGYLRFKPPVKKKKWTDVLKATKEGNPCLQFDAKTKEVIGSEDCLVINLYTPHTEFTDLQQDNLKAVIVWIYGGGFVQGTTISELYGPDFIMEQNVILASMNYRLGPLGFLNINHDNATGNAGLKDQNLALKWIKQNIVKFGGDPNRITILGQSAGAASVDYHVLSHMSKGLFSGSVAMSGSPLCFFWGLQSQKEALLRAFELGSKLGAKPKNKDELLKILYEASAKDMILIANEQVILVPFRPTIESILVAKDEEKFLTSCPIDKYRSGNYNKHPHMTGFTSQEAKGLASDIQNFVKKNEKSLLNNTSGMAKEIMQNFLTTSSMKLLVKLASDLYIVTGVDAKQKFMSLNNENPIYYYRFSYDSWYGRARNYSNSFNISGVAHAEDLFYLFYFSSRGLSFDDPEINHIIDMYTISITNFAKYGNPTPIGKENSLNGLTWPVSGKSGFHVEINKNPTIESRPVTSDVAVEQQAGFGTSPLLTGCF